MNTLTNIMAAILKFINCACVLGVWIIEVSDNQDSDNRGCTVSHTVTCAVTHNVIRIHVVLTKLSIAELVRFRLLVDPLHVSEEHYASTVAAPRFLDWHKYPLVKHHVTVDGLVSVRDKILGWLDKDPVLVDCL